MENIDAWNEVLSKLGTINKGESDTIDDQWNRIVSLHTNSEGAFLALMKCLSKMNKKYPEGWASYIRTSEKMMISLIDFVKDRRSLKFFVTIQKALDLRAEDARTNIYSMVTSTNVIVNLFHEWCNCPELISTVENISMIYEIPKTEVFRPLFWCLTDISPDYRYISYLIKSFELENERGSFFYKSLYFSTANPDTETQLEFLLSHFTIDNNDLIEAFNTWSDLEDNGKYKKRIRPEYMGILKKYIPDLDPRLVPDKE